MLKQNQRKITKILAGISGVLFLGGSLLLWVNASQNKITVDWIKDQTLANKFSTVHFNVWGNDFGGGFFWTEAKALATPQEVTAKGERLRCSAQIRGFYYNSQRGERLWPLDTDSQGDLARIQSSYNPSQLTINWGFYTNCQKEQAGKLIPENEDGRTNSLYGIYGRITHTYKGREYSIYAGLLNNLQQNELPTAELRCNFQRIDNQYPFGYIYDKAGGIALVGAYVKSENLAQVNAFHKSFTEKLDARKCVNDFYSLREDPNNPEKTIPQTDDSILWPKDDTLIFGDGNALETMMNLGIRGIVGLSSQVQTSDQKGIENNTQKTSLLVSTTENISNIINIANKRAESLCRNRWGSLTPNGDIICAKSAKNGGSIDPKSYAGKTIVIKEGNLTLTKYMETTSQPITILLIHGDLILPNTNASQTFLGNGYPDRDGIIKANFLKGNFIINGLIQNQGTEEITNKLIVHGKIASFNTLQEPNVQTKVKLREIGIDTSKKIWLSEIFTWKCNIDTGKDTVGNPCGQENDGTSKSFLIDKSFGLIDMYFPSKLFK